MHSIHNWRHFLGTGTYADIKFILENNYICDFFKVLDYIT